MDDEELIPKIQVLEDMYEDKGLVSLAARDYYYEHYADEDERKRMDRADMLRTIIAYAFLLSPLLGILIAIVKDVVGK